MTPLLRRAPREVYRVYTEDEFFASQVADETVAQSTPGADPWLLRLAAAAMLLAALGAVGGLVAIASGSSATRAGRRFGSGLLAAAGSRGSSPLAGAHVWQQPAAAAAAGSPSAGRSVANTTPALPARRTGAASRAGAARGSNAAAGQRSAAVAVAAAAAMRPVGGRAVEIASPPVSAPVAAGAPMPGASPGRPAPEQSEFGFEHRGPQ